MPPSDKCEDDSCGTLISTRSLSTQPVGTVLIGSLPFIITFLIVSIAVLYKLFPLLSGQQHLKGDDDIYLPSHAPQSLRRSQAEHATKSIRRRIAAAAFSTTIALATVLAELILCEISNALDPTARAIALRTTVPTLLFLLIVLIPFLEIQSVIRGAGWNFQSSRIGGISKLPWLLQLGGFALWLTGFWWLGKGLPGTYIHDSPAQNVASLSDACLERVGVIGISLMALLSGFASVSSPWQSFGARPRPVSEPDIARKQAGLDATNDMLGAKHSRLRALQRKMSDAPQEGFMTKVIGTIRGNADAQEVRALQLEISGLETMALSLSNSLNMLRTRFAATQRAASRLGKAMIIPSYGFSIYCLYRIIATSVATIHRWYNPASVFSNTDPINRVLGLLAKHWDPTLDQTAWSRQISFLLSGVILLASFNSVLQTFHIFTRFMPSLLYQAQANLALIVGQISATYVISSALLLRSNLPQEVGSVISDALGSPLDTYFVDRWFEGWFLVGGAATALGIWLGRKIGAGEGVEWDDYGDDVEMQKRS